MRYVPLSARNKDAWLAHAGREINSLIQRKLNILSKTSAYTIEDGDDIILGDATAGAFSVTLPSASDYEGRQFIVKKIDASANAVTLDGNGAETIDGAATQALAAQWDSIWVVSNGTAWFKV